MLNNKISNLIILFILLYISQSSIIYSIQFLFIFFLFLLFIYFMRQRKNDSIILIILLTWIILSSLAFFIFGVEYKEFRILVVSIELILLPYLILRIIGRSFWDKFENITFILTTISLPIYTVHLFYPGLFNNLGKIFKPVTRDIFYTLSNSELSYYYWSSFIYVNTSGGGEIRNSGFMWEPGAFAMIIIWAIVYNMLTKGKKIDRRFIIYAVALATTQSTAGYLAFFLIIIAFYFNKKTAINIIMATTLTLIFLQYVYKLDFLGPKINSYIEAYQTRDLTYNEYYHAIKVNRFMIVYYDVIKVIKYPFGYGVVTGEDFSSEIQIVGVNGLSSLLVMWGVPIFIFILILIMRYINLINVYNYSKRVVYFMLIGILLMFFSNPIQNNIFVYLIIFTPLIHNGRENWI